MKLKTLKIDIKINLKNRFINFLKIFVNLLILFNLKLNWNFYFF